MPNTVLVDAAERILRDASKRGAARGGGSDCAWSDITWNALQDFGLPQALLSAEHGGLGIPPSDVADMLRLAGYWASPVPLAEAILGACLVGDVGGDANGLLTLAPPHQTSVILEQRASGWFVEGTARRVPWARHATKIALVAAVEGRSLAVVVTSNDCAIVNGDNLAGEPRDDTSFGVALPAQAVHHTSFDAKTIHAAGAALRTTMMAGAAERLLDMSVEFAVSHNQFGRPIAKFQAVQQNLAVLAGHVAVCRAAGEVAAHALMSRDDVLSVAMAKARAGEAAAQAARLAHQIHGAIGFTAEHELRVFSTRILSWREEYGAEAEWYTLVGQACLDHGAGPWSLITEHGRYV